MGFYIRKSFGLGPVRLNLSKRGIGTSVGMKGARISQGADERKKRVRPTFFGSPLAPPPF